MPRQLVDKYIRAAIGEERAFVKAAKHNAKEKKLSNRYGHAIVGYTMKWGWEDNPSFGN